MVCPESSCGEENLRCLERSESSGVVLKFAGLRRLRRRQLRRFCINVCEQPLRKIGFVSRSRQLGEVCAREIIALSENRAILNNLLRVAK